MFLIFPTDSCLFPDTYFPFFKKIKNCWKQKYIILIIIIPERVKLRDASLA